MFVVFELKGCIAVTLNTCYILDIVHIIGVDTFADCMYFNTWSEGL